jgi:hypothetical protein
MRCRTPRSEGAGTHCIYGNPFTLPYQYSSPLTWKQGTCKFPIEGMYVLQSLRSTRVILFIRLVVMLRCENAETVV